VFVERGTDRGVTGLRHIAVVTRIDVPPARSLNVATGTVTSIDSFDLPDELRTMRRIRLDEIDGVETHEPLLITGAVTGSRAFASWDHATLREQYGSLVCQVSDDSRPGYMRKPRYIHQPLGAYLETLDRDPRDGRHPYLFHTFRLGELTESIATDQLVSDVAELSDLMGFEHQKFRFYVGPRLCGALPHAHDSAANALVRGRKRWAIYVGSSQSQHAELADEAYREYPPGSFAVDWFARECGRLRQRGIRMWECIQEAGDVVAIPGGMLHAVINLTSVIGLVTEEIDDAAASET
jgi:Cupin-like domain